MRALISIIFNTNRKLGIYQLKTNHVGRMRYMHVVLELVAISSRIGRNQCLLFLTPTSLTTDSTTTTNIPIGYPFIVAVINSRAETQPGNIMGSFH